MATVDKMLMARSPTAFRRHAEGGCCSASDFNGDESSAAQGGLKSKDFTGWICQEAKQKEAVPLAAALSPMQRLKRLRSIPQKNSTIDLPTSLDGHCCRQELPAINTSWPRGPPKWVLCSQGHEMQYALHRPVRKST